MTTGLIQAPCWRTPISRLPRHGTVAQLVCLGLALVNISSVPLHDLAAAKTSTARTAPRKRALLVGISRYPQSGKAPWRPLDAHQDVVQLKAALLEHGFAPDDVMVLEDGEATAAGIRTAFRSHLIDDARPGDTLSFHFSGHGQQVPDDNGDELDGLDETLVPADATDQHARAGDKTNIRDDELGAWLQALTDKLRGPDKKLHGSVTVTLDSCFSGTANRGDLVERGHGWDVTLDGPPPPMRGTTRGAQLIGSMQDGQSEVQFLSAALSTQTAKEHNGMGVFSHALVQSLRRADRQTTYRALVDDISYEMAHSGVREQTPWFEGHADHLLFHGEARPHEPTMRVVDVNGDQLTLAAGEVHLVTVGSIYALHRAGTDKLGDATKLGDAEVISVSPTQSVLRVRPSAKIPQDVTAKTMLRRARVVETAHRYTDRPLRVRFLGLAADLIKALRAIPVLTTEGTAGTNYDVEVRAEKGTLGLYRPEAKERFAKVDTGADTVAQIDSLLRAEWRWRSLMNLRSQDSAAQVKLRLVPVQCPTGSLPPGLVLTERPVRSQTEPLRLHAGDCYQLELRNPTYNDLWTTVFQLAADGSIEASFPRADGSIEPTFPHPGEANMQLIPHVTTKRIPTPYVYQVQLAPDRNHERSAFKVITTTTPLNLSALIQSAYQISQQSAESRGQGRSDLTDQVDAAQPGLGPLLRLLVDSALGERGGTGHPISLEDWGVTTTYLDQDRNP